MSTTIAPGATVEKDITDEEVYQFEFADNLPAGAVISSHSVLQQALTPASARPLAIDQDGHTSTTVTMRVAGGQQKALYRVGVTIRTNETPTRTRTKSFKVYIKDQ